MRRISNLLVFALMQYQAEAADERVYTKTSVNPDKGQLAEILSRDLTKPIPKDCYSTENGYDNSKCKSDEQCASWNDNTDKFNPKFLAGCLDETYCRKVGMYQGF